MIINTTLLIALIFLIPSLVFFFFPYKNENCRAGGIAFAVSLLILCILITSARMASDHYSDQKTDLSSFLVFKKSADISTIYSKLSKE